MRNKQFDCLSKCLIILVLILASAGFEQLCENSSKDFSISIQSSELKEFDAKLHYFMNWLVLPNLNDT